MSAVVVCDWCKQAMDGKPRLDVTVSYPLPNGTLVRRNAEFDGWACAASWEEANRPNLQEIAQQQQGVQ